MYGPRVQEERSCSGPAYWAGMGKELSVLIAGGLAGQYSVLALK